MKILATEPLSFGELLARCFVGYPRVFKNIWYLLLAILVMNLITAFIMRWNVYVGGTVFILQLLLVLFLFAIALHISQTVLSDKPVNLQESVAIAKRRYLFLLGGIILLFAIMVIATMIDFGIFAIGDWSGLRGLAFVIALIFSIFAGLIFYFSLPLIVLERHRILRNFEKSAKLFLNNPWRIAGVFIVIHFLTMLLTVAGMYFIHGPGFSPMYIVYSLLVQFFIYPLLFVTILVLLHDANLRLARKNEIKSA